MLLDKMYDMINPNSGERFGVYLITHANPETKIFSRTYKQISADLGIPRSSVEYYFKSLKKAGVIVKVGPDKWYIPAIECRSETCEAPGYYLTSGYIPSRQKPKT